jgi:hypothetical protein
MFIRKTMKQTRSLVAVNVIYLFIYLLLGVIILYSREDGLL